MDNKENEELMFVEKPIRKPDKRVLGRMESWEDSDFQQFVPVQSGGSYKRSVVKSSGHAKLIKNEGENNSSYTLHVNYPGDDDNFADKMICDVNQALKSYVKKEVPLPTAKFVCNEENLKVWLSRERKKLCFHIELDSVGDINLIRKNFSSIVYDATRFINPKNFK